MSQSSNSPVLVFLFAQSPDKTKLSGLNEESDIVDNELLQTSNALGLIKLVHKSSAERKHLTNYL